MIIHFGNDYPSLKNPYVTVGVFDGVHLGHRALLNQLVLKAGNAGRESVVITFEPHPKLVLPGNKSNLSFLSTPEEKKELLGKSGIDHLIIMPFTSELAEMGAGQFIREILVQKIGAGYLLVGYDNHLGKGRDADFKSIREHALIYGMETEQVEGIKSPEGFISSTSIRNALLSGNLDEANACLGYSYSLTGEVVPGKNLGHLLGFPTANIMAPKNKLVPADGVYAVDTIIGNDKYNGMLSIGVNPTVNKDRKIRSVEVNIFGFDGYLYGQTIKVVFRYWLREEKNFANTGQLSDQMKLDKIEALRLLT
ncbi:MAG: riboflavin biosynthesis protein RibF [Bacteroidales bacterium]|nr:riboflavin biosynthesis protein RibF [Bacteroidales bacterium]